MKGMSMLLCLFLVATACGTADESVRDSGEPFVADMTFTTVGMQLATEAEEGRSTFGGRCSEPSTWVIRFDLTGESPTLGPLTGTAEHCSQVLEWREVGEERAPDSVTYGDGIFTLVTVAGDTLSGVYTDGLGGTNPDGTMWFRDRLTFTAGTGRFEGVSGEAEEEGTFTSPELPATLRMEGVLRQGASGPHAG